MHHTTHAVWRIEFPRIIAPIARDDGLGEKLAQRALVAAREQWPRSGIPDNSGSWLRRNLAPSIAHVRISSVAALTCQTVKQGARMKTRVLIPALFGVL